MKLNTVAVRSKYKFAKSVKPKAKSVKPKAKFSVPHILLVLLSLLFTNLSVAHAQFGGEDDSPPIFPVGDIQGRYNSLNLDVLDDGLMGDQIDLDTGALSFSQMDVSIPGNSTLPVQFGRKLSRSSLRSGIMGNWAPDIPLMSRNYATQGSQTYGKNSDRCSGDLYPATKEVFVNGQARQFRAEGYFNGYNIDVPGQNPGKLIQARGSNNVIYSDEFSTTGAYLTTTENWFIGCIPSIPGGGEGYIAHAPNGNTFEFTHLVNTHVREFDFGDKTFQVFAETLYVTKINDVHGNWVKFEYSGAKLTRIHSNDLREITFTYSGGKLSTVNANGRVWTYLYSGGNLSRVNLPDGRYWTFTNNGNDLLALDPITSRDICFKIPVPDIQVRHPSGTVAHFEFEVIRNGRKNVEFRQENYPWVNQSLSSGPSSAPPQSIFDCTDDGDSRSKQPSSFWSFAVTEKRLVLLNGPTHIWTREYEEDQGSYNYPNYVTPWSPYNANLSDTKTRTVTDPEGHKTVTYINRTFGRQEGQIEKVEIIPSGSSIPIQTTEYDYATGNLVGLSLGARDHGYTGADSVRIYKTRSVVSRDGDTFTTEMSYNTDETKSTFSYGAPTQSKSYSNVNTIARARITDTVYEHNKPKWILGLTKTVTQNSRLMFENFYNSDGQKTQYNRYGHLYAKYDYNPDGTLKWAEDALSPPRRTKALNWKRGTPQKVIRPDGSDYEQTVDDNGWITSMTDPMSRVDNYVLDNMGRLTKIDPTGNLWLDTDISYDNLPTGELIQTITKGQSKTTITYDSMLRPTLERTEALDTGWSSYVNTKYDGLGRVIFKSQPSSDPGEIKGITTTYDGLGRVYDIIENNDDNLKTKHRYDSDHKHRIYDPSGAYTEYKSYGYGGPGNTDYSHIDRYAANGTRLQRTQLHKNTWGQLVRLQQSGNHDNNNVDKSQWFEYDDQQRLCSHWTPEQGRTKYNYDAAGQLIEYVKGHGTPTCGEPLGDMWQKVTLTYDDLGRQLKTDFYAPGTPDITKTYDANGNVLTINRGEGETAVNWTYEYNDLNLIVAEDLSVDGRTFTIGNSYNTSGHLKSRRLPAMRTFEQAPDGLGRPTQIQWSNGDETFADDILYHPNGSVQEMAYGNGQYYSQTLNDRLLPLRILSQNETETAIDQTFGYDVRGLVTSITDGAVNGNDRSYSYDGLGHLKTASGPWGNGSYSYDSLGNLRSKQLGSRKVSLNYDSRNRVVKSVDTGFSGTRTIAYDHRGNVTSIGNLTMRYDMSDQPTAVSGSANGVGPANGNYLYDGNLKRVKSFISDGKGYQTIYNIFDSSGKLVHIYNVTKNEKTEYVTGPTGTIARVTNGTPTYMHPDHLGSAQAGTDHTGAVKWREQYTPFGEQIQNPAANDNLDGFTGHIKDKATGLNYMQARYYDPVIGRFLSIDPVTFMDTGEPEYFNRYSYTANDPINATDPTGMSTCADKNCDTSYIDQFPDVTVTIVDTHTGPELVIDMGPEITFVNDVPGGPSTNLPVTTETANMVESAVIASGVDHININSTRGSLGVARSSPRHANGQAVDIDTVNGKPVDDLSNFGAVNNLQNAFSTQTNIRENLGPAINQKTETDGRITPKPHLAATHKDHIHVSGQK